MIMKNRKKLIKVNFTQKVYKKGKFYSKSL